MDDRTENNLERAREAEIIVSNRIYQEAFQVVEERLLRRLQAGRLSENEERDIIAMLRAVPLVKGYIQDVMMTGKLALKNESDRRKLRGV